MNTIKEIDILDRSSLSLNNIFSNKIHFKDKPISANKSNFVDGILNINSKEFLYTVMDNPTIGRINSQFKKIEKSITSIENHIFILDYANKALIHFFKNANISFVDTAGNCYINLPDLHIFVEGQENLFGEQISKKKRAFQKTGLKLLFQLLISPDLANETYRAISEKTNISLASIGYIFEELKNDGFIIEVNKQQKRLSNLKRLIIKWAISYTELLRPTINRGHFTSFDPNLLKDKLENINDNALFFGGEYGAYFLNASIKPNPNNIIIYTDSRLSKLAQQYKIVPLGKNNIKPIKIELIEQFWLDNVQESDAHNGYGVTSKIVDPILIYADLMLSNNYRSIETAEKILNNEIRDKFIRHKFQW